MANEDIDYEDNIETNNEDTLILYQNVIIKSHFIAPETNIFYLNNYPQIRYMPYGNVGANRTLNCVATIDGVLSSIQTLQTNNNGYIQLPDALKVASNINLCIVSPENETFRYNYTITEPYSVSVYEHYNTCITYDIEVYDKESFNPLNIGNYINFNENISLQYTHTTPVEDSQKYSFSITASLQNEPNFEGRNTLYVNINNYASEYTFKLFTHPIIIESNLKLGESTITIIANEALHDITLYSEDTNDEWIINALREDDEQTFNIFINNVGQYSFLICGINDNDENISERYIITVEKENVPLILCESLYNNIYANQYQFQPLQSSFEEPITTNMCRRVGGSSGTASYTLEDGLYTRTVNGWSSTENIVITHAQFIEDNIYWPFQFEVDFIYQGDENNAIYIEDSEYNFIKILVQSGGWTVTKSFDTFLYGEVNVASNFEGSYESNKRCYGNNVKLNTLEFYSESFDNTLQNGDVVKLRMILQGQHLQCICITQLKQYEYELNIDYIDVFNEFEVGLNIGYLGSHDRHGHISKFRNIQYTNPEILNNNYYITAQSIDTIPVFAELPYTLYIDNPLNIIRDSIMVLYDENVYGAIAELQDCIPYLTSGPHTIYLSSNGDSNYNSFLLSKTITVYDTAHIINNSNAQRINGTVDLSLLTLDNNNNIIRDGKYVIDNIEYAFDDPITITPHEEQIHIDWIPINSYYDNCSLDITYTDAVKVEPNFISGDFSNDIYSLQAQYDANYGWYIDYEDIQTNTNCTIDFDFQNTMGSWRIGVDNNSGASLFDVSNDYQEIAIISDTNIHHIHIEGHDNNDYLYIDKVLLDNQEITISFENADYIAVLFTGYDMQNTGQVSNIVIADEYSQQE